MKNLFLLLVSVLLSPAVFSQNSIQHVLTNGSRFDHKQVEVSGTVIKTFPLAGLCSYVLEDQGSEILVNSSQGCPDIKDRLTVRGTLGRTSGQDDYYIDEISRSPFTGNTAPKSPGKITAELDFPVAEEVVVEEIDLDEVSIDDGPEVVLEEETPAEEEEVFFIVEDVPSFQGGGIEKFREWIAAHLVFPAEASKNGVSGKVFVQFIVDRTGHVKNARVVRSVHPQLDAEAIRVVESAPPWTPGKMRGRPVNVQYVIPIAFVFQ